MKNFVVLTEDGAFALFFRPPPPHQGIWQLKSPHPREFAIQGKKNANARGEPGGRGAGDSIPFHHFGLALVSNFSR